MPAIIESHVNLQPPHRGQQVIMDCKVRHRVVRCGRRWGKSSMGEIACNCEAIQLNRFVGLFTPQMMYLEEIWRDIRARLAPLIYRANDSKHRIELINGSVIEAWTLENNPDAGRSRKYDLVVVDEAGLIEGFKRWWDSCVEATLIDRVGRAIVLGTPHTAGPDFDDLFDKAESGQDPDWAAFTAKTFDNGYLPESEKRRILAKRTEMPDWLWLQEYEAIPADGASGFFNRALVKSHKATHCCQPVRRGNLAIELGGGLLVSDVERAMVIEKREIIKIRWYDDPAGPWKLWTELDGGRPPQGAAWCAGIDIGAGVGAANSVMSVGDADTGCKWAEYASAGVTPERFAHEAALAGLWFGGRKRHTFIQFETNGPGQVFIRELLRVKYPCISGHRVEPGDQSREVSDYGWTSSTQAKETMLAEYRGALAKGRFINPSEAAINECLTYRYSKTGRLISVAEEPGIDEARAPHGDRVISDGLLWDAMRQIPDVKMVQPPPPKESIGYRIMEYERAKKKSGRLAY